MLRGTLSSAVSAQQMVVHFEKQNGWLRQAFCFIFLMTPKTHHWKIC
jgi:hypothetical protein